MTPGLLQLVDGLRASGDLFTRAGFLVARDAAMEHGVTLRVIRARRVNVKKSNRPPPLVAPSFMGDGSMTLLDAHAMLRSVYSDWPHESDRAFGALDDFSVKYTDWQLPWGFSFLGVDGGPARPAGGSIIRYDIGRR